MSTPDADRQSWFRGRRRLLLPLITAVFALLLLAVALEAFATAYLFFQEGTYIPARTRFASRTNTFVQELADGRDCGYVDTLYPHPYVGFVHHGNPPCGIENINNVGLFGPDFPSSRRDDRFVILLTGGSVANQFLRPVNGGASYLEQMLNEQYVSPNAKPFLILNGADGAWKQPQQTILFLLYADAVDGVVTLDGFNEQYMVGGDLRFEYPANNFATVNPLVAQSFEDVVVLWWLGTVREAAARNAVLSRSQAAYSILTSAQDYLARRADARPDPRTSVESIFRLPRDWTEEQRRAWALDQYRKYIRAMQAIARTQSVRTAFFIQPAPAIGKALSPEEQKVVGDLSYGAIYQTMADNLLGLNAEQIPVVSLLDVFKQERGTLYADPIHLARTKDGTSAGYELIARDMTQHVARLWKLQATAKGTP